MTTSTTTAETPRLNPRIIRRVVLVLFVAGIAAMIASSIADNNGAAVTFGLLTTMAAVSLVLVTAVSPAEALAKPKEAKASTPSTNPQTAKDVEDRIERLVQAGANESEVRKLVSRAVDLGRGK
ncbi:MAG: hypothetical protein RLZZ31_1617 [Actinomycetota bacterium]|jgi:hypothetical protein